jgi:pyrroline-5-carboxylate reductase
MKLLLIGAGNLGTALLNGLGEFETSVIENDVTKIEGLKKEFPNVSFQIYSSDIDMTGFVVILAVKPNTYTKIKLKGKAEALISVMAGVKLQMLRDHFKAEHFIRSMPNIAALCAKSMTAFTGDEAFRDKAYDILSSIGKAVWVDSEKEIDIATAVAGSGPAFLALVADAMSDGAVRAGMNKKVALDFTQGLFEGTAELLKQKHPALIKDEVTSPSGTTTEGLTVLEGSAVRSAFIEAVMAAYKKASDQ